MTEEYKTRVHKNKDFERGRKRVRVRSREAMQFCRNSFSFFLRLLHLRFFFFFFTLFSYFLLCISDFYMLLMEGN